MRIESKKISTSYLVVILLLFFALLSYVTINKFQKIKEEASVVQQISINLIASVHPNLSWDFKPVKPSIKIKLGEVTTAEYIVENLGDKETSGIATFVYFPNQFGTYISKINCFCYDVQTLQPGEQDKYTLVFFIDPEVTKDSKTKNIKEVTIQFTFFDYEEYKKKES